MEPLINSSLPEKRKVFVSYHHENDQYYADTFRDFYGANDTIIDKSLREEIKSDDDDYVLSVIRQKYLKNSTVTIVLIGSETYKRKWIDWEVYSSLRPYKNGLYSRTVNGLLGIVLPTATYIPIRFHNNLISGYARIIKWESVVPPITKQNSPVNTNPLIRATPLPKLTLKDISTSSFERNRRKRLLHSFIEDSYENRERYKDLIDNTTKRFEEDLS